VADVERRVREGRLVSMIRAEVLAGVAATVTDAMVDAYIAGHPRQFRRPERRDSGSSFLVTGAPGSCQARALDGEELAIRHSGRNGPGCSWRERDSESCTGVFRGEHGWARTARWRARWSSSFPVA
jgi:hypothetical protein